MENTKISSRQFTWLLVALSISTQTLIMPSVLIGESQENAWVSIVLATCITGVGVLICVTLAKQFPGQTVVEYAQVLLGRWLGKGVGLFVAISCLLFTAMSIRSFSQLFKVAVLPETPLWAFVVSLTLLAVYTAAQGVEPIARITDIILPFTVFVLLILLALGLPQGKAFLGLPILEFNVSPIVKGSFIVFGYLGESFVVLLLAPSLNNQNELKSAALKGIFFSCLILLITIQAILFEMGAYRASVSLYPLLNLAMELDILDVFERFEPLLLSAWITVAAIKFALFLYLSILSFKQSFGYSLNKYLLIFSVVAVPAIALVQKNFAQHLTWIKEVLFAYVVPINLFVIPLILLIIAKVKKRNG